MQKHIFVKRFHTQLLKITLVRLYFVQILVELRGERDQTEIHKGLEALNPFAKGRFIEWVQHRIVRLLVVRIRHTVMALEQSFFSKP